jgi:[methyl-Co(III) methanol-specific corrinoid protein]:coenzyme M methyltransferase
MNNKERFMNALNHLPVDRPPVVAVATGITVHMMKKCGIYWPDAHTSVDKLAGLAESIYQHTDIECIKLPFDMAVEVEAIGAPIDYRTVDTLPTEKGHIFNKPEELTIPDDFMDRGRVPTVLQAITKLRKRYDEECGIVSSIVGPFSMAAKLYGFNNFLIWIIDHPEFVHQIMAALTPLAIRYATAQVEAGADTIIIGEATCTGDLISPATYRDFIAPYHRKLCPAIPAPTIMHICGKSTRHTPYLADIGTDVYSFDEGVDIQVAKEHLQGKVALAGYVPAVTVLLNGTPKDVYLSAQECLNNGVDLLTPGCAMAPYTSFENINAMTQAVHDWSKARTAGGVL